MKAILTLILFFTYAALNVYGNQIIDNEITQVADFKISEGQKTNNGITFKDSLNGLALIRDQDYKFHIFRTTNADDSWDFIREIDIYNKWALQGVAPPSVTDIACFDDFVCITTEPYLTLFGPPPPADTGVYIISYDFGKTWKVSNFPEKLLLNSIQFDKSGNMYIIGQNWDFRKQTATRKGIFKYIKINDSWEEISLPDLRDSAIMSSLKIYSNNKYQFKLIEILIDGSGIRYTKSYIYITDDNGKNWDTLEIPFVNAIVNNTSENVIWARKVDKFVINDDSIVYRILLYKTIDKGVKWEIQIDSIIILPKVALPVQMSNFIAYDDENIWLIISGGRQFITNNGGKNWAIFPEYDKNIMRMTPTQGYYLNKNSLLLLNFFEGHLLYKFTFDIATKVEYTNENNKFIHIYPNPATEYIEINSTSINRKSGVVLDEIKIFNTRGECVIFLSAITSTSSGFDNIKIDVSHLPIGGYYVKFGNRTQMFIKM